MKLRLTGKQLRYATSLKAHLKKAVPRKPVHAAPEMDALSALHERILVEDVLPKAPHPRRASLITMAGAFFAAQIEPAEMQQTIEGLSQRTIDLAASNRELREEIARLKASEIALEQRAAESLHSRRLSRHVLAAQEEERKKISRELHDVIAQTLAGINVRLATLKREAELDASGLKRNIERTQRMVEKSVDIVYRFARELRPPVLDDLGLIPALHSFMKGFTTRTGVRSALTSTAEVEKLGGAERTVLFRVAQESLTNVARHAEAARVEVNITKSPTGICMKISDDGKSFSLPRVMHARRNIRLGLQGMKERLEMVGGTFSVESAAGQGTTIIGEIPLKRPRRGRPS